MRNLFAVTTAALFLTACGPMHFYSRLDDNSGQAEKAERLYAAIDKTVDADLISGSMQRVEADEIRSKSLAAVQIIRASASSGFGIDLSVLQQQAKRAGVLDEG